MHGQAKQSNTAYYTFTLGLSGQQANDVVNINIGNGLKVNGANIADGNPHHGTFPIKGMDNSHWRWIEATAQTSTDSKALDLSIHKVSPAKGERAASTSDDSAWDQVNLKIRLPLRPEPRHVDAEEYNSLAAGVRRLQMPAWTREPDHLTINMRNSH